jgi:hypothetical protein
MKRTKLWGLIKRTLLAVLKRTRLATNRSKLSVVLKRFVCNTGNVPGIKWVYLVLKFFEKNEDLKRVWNWKDDFEKMDLKR